MFLLIDKEKIHFCLLEWQKYWKFQGRWECKQIGTLTIDGVVKWYNLF